MGYLHKLNRRFAKGVFKPVKAEPVAATASNSWRSHYDTCTSMLLSLDPRNQKVVCCNATIAHRLGYAEQEMLDMSPDNLYATGSRERAREALSPLACGGSLYHVELQALCKNGSVFDISLCATPVLTRDGALQRYDIVWQDITQSRELEIRLDKLNKQLTTLYLLGEQILRHNNPHALMHSVAYSLSQTLSVRSVLVCELSFDGYSLIVQAAIGIPQYVVRCAEPQRICPGSLPARALAQGGTLILSSEVNPQWLDGMRYFEGVPPDKGVASVISDGEKSVGLIMVFHGASANFSADDIDYIQSLANLLSITEDRVRTLSARGTFRHRKDMR